MDPAHVTVLIEKAKKGDAGSSARLIEVVYDQLRALAGSYTGGRDANHTLHATALVHEAFVKLVRADGQKYNDRGHFFAIAATAMRQILSDHARRKRAAKRGGESAQVLSDVDTLCVSGGLGKSDGEEMFDVVALDDALEQLQRFDPRLYKVVELRFFGGLEVAQVAEVLGVSKSTVEADWRGARAWLAAKMYA